MRLLDMTPHRSLPKGDPIAEVLGGTDYAISQSFAHFVFRQDIVGIKWCSQKDPSCRTENIAVFRRLAGPDDGTLFEVARTYGVERGLVGQVLRRRPPPSRRRE